MRWLFRLGLGLGRISEVKFVSKGQFGFSKDQDKKRVRGLKGVGYFSLGYVGAINTVKVGRRRRSTKLLPVVVEQLNNKLTIAYW